MSRPAEIPKLSRRDLVQAVVGLALCAFGFFLAHRDAAGVRTVLATAGGCNMPTDIYEPRSGTPGGSVVLLHGLAADKKVMQFTAQEFANQDLRVFVPDLPGHGKAPGPFSPARAETCALALVRDLAARKAILPERTILAGHSMGGAIAVRVAAQFPLAGAIAISPAPMQSSVDVSPELLLFQAHPRLPSHSLVLSASWEPARIRQIAAELVSQSGDSTSRYAIVPGTTHVSILFSPRTFDWLRDWTAQLLGGNSSAPFPRNRPALGCLIGVAGLALLVPPFLREIIPGSSVDHLEASPPAVSFTRAILTLGILSLAAVFLLRFANPFGFLHIFQGGYLASLLFLAGSGVLILHRKQLPAFKDFFTPTALTACGAGLILLLLFSAWFELTFHEAWPTAGRLLRLPALFLAFLPWHIAEEMLLGTSTKSPNPRRVLLALLLRAIVWLFAIAAVFYLHSGQFIYVLMPLYFAALSILQRLAIDVVSSRSRSLSAAAIFGAILLAGFVLAILPVA